MPSYVLSDRLRRIVDVVFGGNATLAASVADLAPPAFHRLLTGTVANPRLSTALKLGTSFGVPLEYVLGILEAQQFGGLPEEFWLLRSYYSAVQLPVRQALAKTSGQASGTKRMEMRELNNISELSISPVEAGSELQPTLGWLFQNVRSPTSAQVGVLRQFYDVETAALKLALQTHQRSDKTTKKGD